MYFIYVYDMEKGIQKNGHQYNYLIEQIGDLLLQGRRQSAYAVNNVLVQTYWQIGKYIVEYEQGGLEKSEYGSKLLDRLSKDLTMLYGRGFSRSNLNYMRKFYNVFAICETVSHKFEKKNTLIEIGETLSHQLSSNPALPEICATVSHKLSSNPALSEISGTLSHQFNKKSC